MKKTLFLIFSAAIFIFSIICICSAPILNKMSINSFNPSNWGYSNCKMLSDEYKEAKKLTSDKKALKPYKHALNLCNRQKAVYGLEYASLILDVILGFLCLILGLLHYFDVGKPFEKLTGIIGLATGVIQFVLTLVYVCYSGYIFTNDGPGNTYLLKADKDGVIATWDESKNQYKCDFYDEDDSDAIYAKYNEMGKKIYNYDKDVSQAESTSPVKKCSYTKNSADPNPLKPSECNDNQGYLDTGSASKFDGDCDALYIGYSFSGYENKYIYDRWVTTLIFACFIIAKIKVVTHLS